MFDVERVEVEGAVGAGATGLGDVFQRFAGRECANRGAAPGDVALARFDAHEDCADAGDGIVDGVRGAEWGAKLSSTGMTSVCVICIS